MRVSPRGYNNREISTGINWAYAADLAVLVVIAFPPGKCRRNLPRGTSNQEFHRNHGITNRRRKLMAWRQIYEMPTAVVELHVFFANNRHILGLPPHVRERHIWFTRFHFPNLICLSIDELTSPVEAIGQSVITVDTSMILIFAPGIDPVFEKSLIWFSVLSFPAPETILMAVVGLLIVEYFLDLSS